MADETVSHGDIYRALGILEGKLDSLGQQLTQKHSDLGDAFKRLNALEKSVEKWAGIALACSFIIPILITAAAPRLHFGAEPRAEARPR